MNCTHKSENNKSVKISNNDESRECHIIQPVVSVIMFALLYPRPAVWKDISGLSKCYEKCLKCFYFRNQKYALEQNISELINLKWSRESWETWKWDESTALIPCEFIKKNELIRNSVEKYINVKVSGIRMNKYVILWNLSRSLSSIKRILWRRYEEMSKIGIDKDEIG